MVNWGIAVYKKKCQRKECSEYFEVGPGRSYASRNFCDQHNGKWNYKKRGKENDKLSKLPDL